MGMLGVDSLWKTSSSILPRSDSNQCARTTCRLQVFGRNKGPKRFGAGQLNLPGGESGKCWWTDSVSSSRSEARTTPVSLNQMHVTGVLDHVADSIRSRKTMSNMEQQTPVLLGSSRQPRDAPRSGRSRKIDHHRQAVACAIACVQASSASRAGYLCTTTLHAFRHDLPLAVTTPEPPFSDGRLSARFDAMSPKVRCCQLMTGDRIQRNFEGFAYILLTATCPSSIFFFPHFSSRPRPRYSAPEIRNSLICRCLNIIHLILWHPRK
jgi:hypothetical protein